MISITITGENRQEITDKFSTLFGGSSDTVVAKPKKEKAAEVVAAPEPEVETGITTEDVRKAVQTAATSGKRDQVKELLKKYKAKNVTELDSAKYQDFVDELELL